MAEESRRDAPSPAPACVPASGEARVGALARRAIAANARLNAIALVTLVLEALALLGALSVDHPWTQRDAVKWWPDRAVA